MTMDWITDAPGVDALEIERPEAIDLEGSFAVDPERDTIFSTRAGTVYAHGLGSGAPRGRWPGWQGRTLLALGSHGTLLIAHPAGVGCLEIDSGARRSLLDLTGDHRPLCIDAGRGLAVYALGREYHDKDGIPETRYDELEIWSLESGSLVFSRPIYEELHRAVFVHDRMLGLTCGTIGGEFITLSLDDKNAVYTRVHQALLPCGPPPHAFALRADPKRGELLRVRLEDGVETTIARGVPASYNRMIWSERGDKALLATTYLGPRGVLCLQIDVDSGQVSGPMRLGLGSPSSMAQISGDRLITQQGHCLRIWNLSKGLHPRPALDATQGAQAPSDAAGRCGSEENQGQSPIPQPLMLQRIAHPERETFRGTIAFQTTV